MNTALRVRISFSREYLFEFCRLGFMADRIGSLWCEGWVYADRLALIDRPYEIL